MNTPDIKELAEHLSKKAGILALEAKALAILAEEPGPAGAAMERIIAGEQGISFVVDLLKKAVAK